MKKFKNILLKILLFLVNISWCLPQNIVGFVVWFYLKVTGRIKFVEFVDYPDGSTIKSYTWTIQSGSMSVGEFRFMYDYRAESTYKTVLAHEYGHTLQSYLLGWLYLPVIAIPSILWCSWISNWKCNIGKEYDTFYTEKWATALGESYLYPKGE